MSDTALTLIDHCCDDVTPSQEASCSHPSVLFPEQKAALGTAQNVSSLSAVGSKHIPSCFDFSRLHSFLSSAAHLWRARTKCLNVRCCIRGELAGVSPGDGEQGGEPSLISCTGHRVCKKDLGRNKGGWPDVFIAAQWSRSAPLEVHQFLRGSFTLTSNPV